VRPQVVVASAGQPAERGSALAGRAWHEPLAPGRLQAWQGPAQLRRSQQTPSTQLPELQVSPVWQTAPSGDLPHELSTQGLPPLQSPDPAQLVLQAPASQM
jgi:hypothetical protein